MNFTLRRSLTNKKFDKPKRLPDKATKLKVVVDKDLVYPAYFVDRWYPFFDNGRALVSKVIPTRVYGMEFGDSSARRRSELVSLWYSWLQDFVRGSRSRAIIVRENKKRKKKEVVAEDRVLVSKYCYLCEAYTKHSIATAFYTCTVCDSSRAPRVPTIGRDREDAEGLPPISRDS